jgi:hypothetical protein
MRTTFPVTFYHRYLRSIPLPFPTIPIEPDSKTSETTPERTKLTVAAKATETVLWDNRLAMHLLDKSKEMRRE